MMINTLGNMAMLPQKLNSSVSNADWNTKRMVREQGRVYRILHQTL